MAKNSNQNDKKKGILPAVLVIVAALLLIAIPILANINTKPIDQLKAAVTNTVLADNFTMQFSTDINGDKAEGTVYLSIDQQQRQLGMFLELSTFSGEFEGGIYEGTFVLRSGSDGSATVTDVADRVDHFFALLDEEGVPDWSVLLDFRNTNIYDELTKDFDFQLLLNCLAQWLDTMNNKSWAKANAGYSKETAQGITTYWYKPDLYTLVTESAPLFEDAFLDPQRYQALLEYTENAKYLLKDGTANLTLRTQNRLLAAVDLTLIYNKKEVRCNLVFSDIGTTQVDTGTVSFYIEQAYIE